MLRNHSLLVRIQCLLLLFLFEKHMQFVVCTLRFFLIHLSKFFDESVHTFRFVAMDLVPLLESDDEDVALFDYVFNNKNRAYQYLEKEPGVFNLDELGDSYCYTYFRFYKADIRLLIRLFNIPQQLSLKSRIKVSAEEAFCIMLRRLAYPNR